ncbi:transketolase family protein, partial [Candidatus Woesearchaeota archaeon]
IKPLDTRTLVRSAKKTGCVVTAEEHQVLGGLGSAVAEVLAREAPVPMAFVGVQDSFGESGRWQELLVKYKLMPEDICNAVRRVLRKRPLA